MAVEQELLLRGDGKRRKALTVLANVLPFLYAAITIVVVWQAVVLITRPSPSVLPTPVAVFWEFVELLGDGQLARDAAYSLGRVIVAWLLSAFIAIPLGLLMGSSERLERFVNPFVELLRPISPLAWIPMAILWFGIGEAGKVFVVFIGTFFPILLHTVAGVKAVDPNLLHAGRVFGCTTQGSLFLRVVVPASIPDVVVGLRLSFGIGWAYIIAAELVAAHVGLGFLISNGMDLLRADMVFVGMIAIGVLGFLLDTLFRFLQLHFTGRA